MICVLISAMWLTGCYRSTVAPNDCKNNPTAEYSSNDGRWKSVAFLRQCGGGPNELQVSVLPTTVSLSNEPGNAFREDATREGAEGRHSYRMQQLWKGSHELWISHERGMKVGYAASAVGVVTVVHTDEDILEH